MMAYERSRKGQNMLGQLCRIIVTGRKRKVVRPVSWLLGSHHDCGTSTMGSDYRRLGTLTRLRELKK